MVNATSILAVVSRRYEIPTFALIRNGRSAKVSRARHLAMYLCRSVGQISYAEIGRVFGGRHHTTVMHAIQRVENSPELLAEAREYVPESFDASVDHSRMQILQALESAQRALRKAQTEIALARDELQRRG